MYINNKKYIKKFLIFDDKTNVEITTGDYICHYYRLYVFGVH